MILVSNIKLPLDTDFNNLKAIAAKTLNISPAKITRVRIKRKSVDARHKQNIHFCVSLLIETRLDEKRIVSRIKDAQIYKSQKYVWQKAKALPENPPVVVGFGPAGMFAALTLARAGLKPIVVERGEQVELRTKTVNSFWQGGKLNVNSNVQFGEGGAGTFSDGKLNTGIKDIRCQTVLETFVQFGAKENILYDAKPHVGTDVLVNIVRNIREEIVSLGGQIHFCSVATNIDKDNKTLTVQTPDGNREIAFSNLILAIGHSARDTFELLKKMGVSMEQKPFSVGVRIEHSQKAINKALYGDFAEHEALGSADYKLAVHLPNGRGVYTFCMCPGGVVVNSASEEESVVTNGMSYSARDGKNANSALLVGVDPEDLGSDDVLAGVYFQRQIERRAYKIAEGKVPVQRVGDFLGESFGESTEVLPTVLPSVKYVSIAEILPDFVSAALRQGIIELDKKLNGFADSGAVLSAPETRSSSPVRILRGEDFTSDFAQWLYPCGEGAGYAGGIMSAAVDGMRVAESIVNKM